MVEPEPFTYRPRLFVSPPVTVSRPFTSTLPPPPLLTRYSALTLFSTPDTIVPA